jgi:hypothetical protein
MRPRLLASLSIVLAGCSHKGAAAGGNDSTAVRADSVETAATATAEIPPMPAYPSVKDGELAVHGVGALALERSWAARAGRCARPPMILLIAEQPGSGVSVLLQLPTEEPFTRTYPVALADSTGAPTPPASQLGFQLFDNNTAEAYQASDGAVEVTELTDTQVSGRFAVGVRHIVSNRRGNVAGAFRQVNVEALPLDWCERAAAAQDSLAAATRDSLAAAVDSGRKSP